MIFFPPVLDCKKAIMPDTNAIPNLYIVDHWMPFPSSEYGGVQCVVAYSDAECERILADSVDEYYRKDVPNYRERIANEIKKAKRFPVDAADVGIVYEFLT
jgi:hypothetical protein